MESLKQLVILPDDPNDCWQWNGRITKLGYGKKTFNGKTCIAHRWIYELLFGKIPDDKVITHSCNNIACVNPYHLVLSTRSNVKRKTNKLTEEKAKELKKRIETLEWGGRNALAKEFGVSPALISDIKYGRAWADA